MWKLLPLPEPYSGYHRNTLTLASLSVKTSALVALGYMLSEAIFPETTTTHMFPLPPCPVKLGSSVCFGAYILLLYIAASVYFSDLAS